MHYYVCPVCKDELYSPMEKLCIDIFNKCTVHLDDEEVEKLLELAEKKL